jgi:hypothetical protein
MPSRINQIHFFVTSGRHEVVLDVAPVVVVAITAYLNLTDALYNPKEPAGASWDG